MIQNNYFATTSDSSILHNLKNIRSREGCPMSTHQEVAKLASKLMIKVDECLHELGNFACLI